MVHNTQVQHKLWRGIKIFLRALSQCSFLITAGSGEFSSSWSHLHPTAMSPLGSSTRGHISGELLFSQLLPAPLSATLHCSSDPCISGWTLSITPIIGRSVAFLSHVAAGHHPICPSRCWAKLWIFFELHFCFLACLLQFNRIHKQPAGQPYHLFTRWAVYCHSLGFWFCILLVRIICCTSFDVLPFLPQLFHQSLVRAHLGLQAMVQNLHVFDFFFQLIVFHAEVGDRTSEVPYLISQCFIERDQILKWHLLGMSMPAVEERSGVWRSGALENWRKRKGDKKMLVILIILNLMFSVTAFDHHPAPGDHFSLSAGPLLAHHYSHGLRLLWKLYAVHFGSTPLALKEQKSSTYELHIL